MHFTFGNIFSVLYAVCSYVCLSVFLYSSFFLPVFMGHMLPEINLIRKSSGNWTDQGGHGSYVRRRVDRMQNVISAKRQDREILLTSGNNMIDNQFSSQRYIQFMTGPDTTYP